MKTNLIPKSKDNVGQKKSSLVGRKDYVGGIGASHQQPHLTLLSICGISHSVGDIHSVISRTTTLLVHPLRGPHVRVGKIGGLSLEETFLASTTHPPTLFMSLLSSFPISGDLLRLLSYKIKQNQEGKSFGWKKRQQNPTISVQYI